MEERAFEGLVWNGSGKKAGKRTHLIKKIDQSSQLGTLKARRVLLFFIGSNPGVENA
jgi:hypothetical protein